MTLKSHHAEEIREMLNHAIETKERAAKDAAMWRTSAFSQQFGTSEAHKEFERMDAIESAANSLAWKAREALRALGG